MKLTSLSLLVCGVLLVLPACATGQQLFDGGVIQQANALQPKIETWRKSLAEIAIPALSSLHYDQGKILERHKTRTLKDLELLNGVADSIRKGPESLQDDVLLMTFT